MSARIFPWLEEAPRPDQMADAPARPRQEKPKEKKDAAKTQRGAAKTQRRRWDKAKIV